MILGDWLKTAQAALEGAACEDAQLDARLIAAGVLALSPGSLRFRLDRELTGQEENELNARLQRRICKEPLQYIENTAYFMGLAFYVDENVLIPRQDTETLCEAALEKMKGVHAPCVLDMCTGSGALAVSIAHYRPDAQVTGADISKAALCVSEKNARMNRARVRFVESDLFSNLENELFDVIVCNPPYLTGADMLSLQEEVKREPALALFGGEDGLDFYRRLSENMKKHLAPGGCALFEVGMGQDEDVLQIMKHTSFAQSGIIKDLCGVNRVVWIRSND